MADQLRHLFRNQARVFKNRSIAWREKVLDVRRVKKIAIIGGGLSGWLSALMLRRVFSANVDIAVFEDPNFPCFKGGEGGLHHFIAMVRRLNIDLQHFVHTTKPTFKMGNVFRGFRNGSASDIFYNLHPGMNDHLEELDFSLYGFWPYLATAIASGVPLETIFPAFVLIEQKASQIEATAVFNTHGSGVEPTLHFDCRLVVDYLKKIGMERKIRTFARKVVDFEISPDGHVDALKLSGGDIFNVDFVIDASGLRHLLVGQKLNGKWHSFSDSLLTNSAIDFRLANSGAKVDLVSEYSATPAGYICRIPLSDHYSGIHVFSNNHTDWSRAKREVELLFRSPVAARPVITFDPGNFEKTWMGNAIAIGVSSGYLGPLQASATETTIHQIARLERILLECNGVIGEHIIEDYNKSNNAAFKANADFLRMHFDGGRRDTAFWRDAASARRSSHYQQMLACFAERLPRVIDFENYGAGFPPLYHVLDWLFIASSLGIVSKLAALNELEGLPPNIRDRMERYGRDVLARGNAQNELGAQSDLGAQSELPLQNGLGAEGELSPQNGLGAQSKLNAQKNLPPVSGHSFGQEPLHEGEEIKEAGQNWQRGGYQFQFANHAPFSQARTEQEKGGVHAG